MRRNVLTTVIAGAVLALSACAGDGTGPGGDGSLTQAEIAQLNQAILGVSYGVRGQQTASRATSPTGESDGSLNFTFDETAPCQPSGSVGVAGSIGMVWNDAAETGGMSADFSVAHDGCVHPLDNGDVITLTGDPDIDVTLDLTTGPAGVTSLVITEKGAFNWSKDAGNNGHCTLDVAAQLNTTTGQVHVTGTFCGVDVSGVYDPED